MQAGVGIEWVLCDEDDTSITEFRYFARKGVQLEAAVQKAGGR